MSVLAPLWEARSVPTRYSFSATARKEEWDYIQLLPLGGVSQESVEKQEEGLHLGIEDLRTISSTQLCSINGQSV